MLLRWSDQERWLLREHLAEITRRACHGARTRHQERDLIGFRACLELLKPAVALAIDTDLHLGHKLTEDATLLALAVDHVAQCVGLAIAGDLHNRVLNHLHFLATPVVLLLLGQLTLEERKRVHGLLGPRHDAHLDDEGVKLQHLQGEELGLELLSKFGQLLQILAVGAAWSLVEAIDLNKKDLLLLGSLD